MTTPRKVSAGSAGSPPPRMQDHSHSWTDDLPVCYLSGVGFSTNQHYREDGLRQEEHEFEDKSFHFRVEEDTYLYGVFDGHDGATVSNFAAQRMPAELLLGQLTGKTNDEDIKSILRQAFMSVERGYFDSIDDVLTEKAKLQLHLPEGMTAYEAYHQFPDLYKKLESLEAEISGGTTAVVALIYNNRLYVANVGSCRALLCKKDPEGVLRVSQLTVDHVLTNQDELHRLMNCGVDVQMLCHAGKLGSHEYTRTLGDYNLKCSYKEMEGLSTASSKPVIPEPEISGGMQLDESCSFLILMSDGLYKSLEAATGTEHINSDIASWVASEFAVQTTLNGVAQAVVDRVVRKHHDTYMTASDHRKDLCQVRDDITLMVRNFNYPLPNAINSPTSGVRVNPASSPFYQPGNNGPLSMVIPASVTQPLFIDTETTVPDECRTNNTTTWTYGASSTFTSTCSNDSTLSSSGEIQFSRRSNVANSIELDADGKIEPYVDFSEYFKGIDEMSDTQKEKFHSDCELRPPYEAIPEESEKDGSGYLAAGADPDRQMIKTMVTEEVDGASGELTDEEVAQLTSRVLNCDVADHQVTLTNQCEPAAASSTE